MATDYSRFTYDHATLLKAAGILAASTVGTVILDLGDGLMKANLVLDVTALEVLTGDEIYTVTLEGSNVAGMATGSVALAEITLGNAPAPADADTALGRHVVPFRNELNGTLYRYVRINTVIAGTIATGINFSAFVGLD